MLDLQSLRDLAGRVIVRQVNIDVLANTPTELLPENFDRLGWIISNVGIASYNVGIGQEPDSNTGLSVAANASPLQFDHAHYGPLVGYGVKVWHASGVSVWFTAYEIVLIN